MTTAITSQRLSSTSARGVRVLVVDDHPVFLHGLRSIVENLPDFRVCGQATSLFEAMEYYRESNPAIIITDISLRDGSGIELVKELIAIDAALKILVCSMHDEMLFAERALRAGAKGYINKEEAAERLVVAIRRVAEGGLYLSDAMTQRIIGRRIGIQHEPIGPAIESLSDRELEVFEQIGRGETTRHIADKMHLSLKTVESYREKIKAKLNLANAAELTQHAVQWVLETA